MSKWTLRALVLGAAIIAFAGDAGAQTPVITQYNIPTPNAGPQFIVAGPDGNLWFTEQDANAIGRITPAGVVTEFAVTTPNSAPVGIVAGPDGNLWFTEFDGNQIGRITPTGTITEFPITTANSQPLGITVGPDGNLWFAESNGDQIGRITPTGTITEFPVLAFNPQFIAAGSDGALWFTETAVDQIGRITVSGTVTEYPLPPGFADPTGIALGPDGNMWFTEVARGRIGQITPSGNITEFPLPFNNTQALAIAKGPDNALWFTQFGSDLIGRITTTGAVSQFSLPGAGTNGPIGIAVGPDKAMWFVTALANHVGRITTLAMDVTPLTDMSVSGPLGGPFTPTSFDYTLRATTPGIGYAISGVPSWLTASSTSGTIDIAGTTITFTVNANVHTMTAGTYGPSTITFTNTSSGIGNTTRSATLTIGPVPATTVAAAVLPASRSVQVNTAATAFATIVNTGTNAGIDCALALGAPLSAGFMYQTTNSATNQLTGTPNTPANIGPGGSQSYAFAVTPNVIFNALDVPITAKCGNSPAATVVPGLNTLLLSSSAVPVPDIVALAATVSNDGVLTVGTSGGAFAVATVNVGSSATITVTADTRFGSLPLALSVCQTNPSTGQCLATPAASVTTTIAAHATPTFAIFAQATGAIPFDPSNNRVYVRFKDFNEDTRGATSVAVKTP